MEFFDAINQKLYALQKTICNESTFDWFVSAGKAWWIIGKLFSGGFRPGPGTQPPFLQFRGHP